MIRAELVGPVTFNVIRQETSVNPHLLFEAFLADALSQGDSEFRYSNCEQAQQLLTRFNRQIDSIIDEYGEDNCSKMIWYLYGILSEMPKDVLDESVSTGRGDFFQSLRSLYDNGFAKYCEDCRGGGGPLGTACYMIWDMDGGLDGCSFFGSNELF